MKKLEEIINGIVRGNNLAAVRLDQESLSYPVAGQNNGKKADCYFVFSNHPNARKGRPYAWLHIDSETGGLMQFAHCSVWDFAERLQVPLEQEIDYSAPMEGTHREIIEAKVKFSRLYGEIREFAFSDALDERQKEKVMQYQELQAQVIGEELLAYYKCLSPQFYSWIEGLF